MGARGPDLARRGGSEGTTPVLKERACRTAACLVFALVLTAPPESLARGYPESQAGAITPRGGAEQHLGAGYADLKNDRYQDAIREFQAALALEPQLVLRARFPLAVAQFELHNLTEARKEFEAVRSQVGDHPDVMYYLGRLDLMEGDNAGAMRNLLKAAADPPFVDTAYYLGLAFLKIKQFAPAEKWLHSAAQAAPRDFRVQESLGLLYRQEGRRAEADKAFALAQELRKSDAEASQERMACIQKLQAGPLVQARPVCEKLFDPNDPAKLTMLGTIYGQHGDYADALKPFQRAAALSPASPQIQYNLGLDCFRLKRYEEARVALSGAAKQWPDLFQLHALLGVALYRLGENPEAYQVLSHAHELNPQDTATADFLYEVSLVLARTSHAQGQDAASLRYLRTAATLQPNDPDPHRLMAAIYGGLGQRERASEERREAQRLAAPSADHSR